MKRKVSDYSGVGILMILIGILVGTPLLFFFFYPQDTRYVWAFLIPSLSSVLLGITVCFCRRKSEVSSDWRTSRRLSSHTVLFAWLWGVLIGALPFLFGKQLTFVQSLFEAVSGWTTTGLSTMDVSKTPMIALFHRSFMQ